MGYNLALARSRLVVADKSIPISNRSWACLAVAVHSGGSRPKPVLLSRKRQARTLPPAAFGKLTPVCNGRHQHSWLPDTSRGLRTFAPLPGMF